MRKQIQIYNPLLNNKQGKLLLNTNISPTVKQQTRKKVAYDNYYLQVSDLMRTACRYKDCISQILDKSPWFNSYSIEYKHIMIKNVTDLTNANKKNKMCNH